MKYIESQTRKIVSRYGGVGSIIETLKGAIIIDPFDKWKFFDKENRTFNAHEYEVNDYRLKMRIGKHFEKLDRLIKVPSDTSSYNNTALPSDYKKSISAHYFPKWMYCPKCDSFKQIDDWWNGWKDTLNGEGKSTDKIADEFTYYDNNKPNCYICYSNAKGSKSKKRYYELEQVRFIMTAPNGEIQDVPWERWPIAQKNVKNDDSEKGEIRLDFEHKCCDKQDLEYKQSTKFADLSGISIICRSCGNRNTLSGLFGLSFPIKTDPKVFSKVVLRSSNSVYYPIITGSIFIPKYNMGFTDSELEIIKNGISDCENTQSIAIALRMSTKKSYQVDKIDEAIEFLENIDSEIKSEPESAYRHDEYKFIIDNPNYHDESTQSLTLVNQNTANLKKYGLGDFIHAKKLKYTIVQTGYTRQEPMDIDNFLKSDSDKIKHKYTSSQAQNTEYLPAIENFGEGIFVTLDYDKVNNWIENSLKNEKFKIRIEVISKNIENEERDLHRKRFQKRTHLIKQILIHTLSHVLIKELEFLCGYPATSLQERLYVDDENMQGVLIYTIAGSASSYGGLISQTKSDQFEKILISALDRAKDCASDPVCYHTHDGQGIGGLNMAACYSCALLPETSCEEYNCLLDRALLVDKVFGYFTK